MAGGLRLDTGAVSGLPQPIPGPRFSLSHIFRLQNQWVFAEVALRTGCSRRSYTPAGCEAAQSPARASWWLPRSGKAPPTPQNGRSGGPVSTWQVVGAVAPSRKAKRINYKTNLKNKMQNPGEPTVPRSAEGSCALRGRAAGSCLLKA